MKIRKTALLCAAIALTALLPAAPVSAEPRALPSIPGTVGTGPAQQGFWAGYAYAQLHPDQAPPGADDFGCRPKPGQNPVVLVHGTYENGYDNWAGLSPVLAKAGYCVFAPSYGRTDVFDQGGVATLLPAANGVAGIARSAAQLGHYIDRVRTATGAAKVDVVAHSQGGLVVRQWMKHDGGADAADPAKTKIGRFVMLATPNHGTTLDGMAWIGRQISDAGLDVMGFYAWLTGTGAIEQSVGSSFIEKLNAGRTTFPGVDYTIVASRYDEVVTPYDSAFLRAPGVRNVTLQNGCEQDTSDHLSMVYSPRAMSIVLNALRGDRTSRAACAANPWLFSF
ncbi:esterase/lipase family protein [Gordonia neofelifaecis]|uniref:Putative lipase n=1 Tax=Gordonia neofelifaecis NRRL B-59395 TaxID=644548 RepID=F1YJW6_9ACTN|nr:alpha/beta fold hydrolase [Gordonia neofelifaecis]EGD55048.1 putative lipase [Gordonia neofelifaecis NRRL B-59395]